MGRSMPQSDVRHSGYMTLLHPSLRRSYTPTMTLAHLGVGRSYTPTKTHVHLGVGHSYTPTKTHVHPSLRRSGTQTKRVFHPYYRPPRIASLSQKLLHSKSMTARKSARGTVLEVYA